MADSFLRMVSRTARFDKKKYGSDIQLFSSQNQEATTSRQVASHELDFFHNDSHTKEKSAAAADDDEEEHKPSAAEDEDDEKQGSSGDAEEEEASSEDSALTAAELRKRHNIHVRGNDVPAPVTQFSQMVARCSVPDFIIDNLRKPEPEGYGYSQPTPIQMQAIPLLCARREVLATAPTGSGKTASYIIPILTHLKNPGKTGFRAVILAPTKELADQIGRHVKKLSQGRKFQVLVLAKANTNKETLTSKRRDILVSTPLRLLHAVEQKELDLSQVDTLILDEADRLFDLGFVEQVDSILLAINNPQRRISLFSATMFQGVETLAKTVLKDPVRVTIGTRNTTAATISQKLVFVGSEDGKLLALRQLFQQGIKPPILIFVQSKERATQLFHELVYEGVNVDVMHAERTQAQRTHVVEKFRSGQIWVLICTDLMARGLDFKTVNCVINYDFPQSNASYIHRIGRTGRAGRSGSAVTFFTEKDKDLLRGIAEVMRHSGCEVPDWLLGLKKLGRAAQQKLKDNPPARERISYEAPAAPKSRKRSRSAQPSDDSSAVAHKPKSAHQKKKAMKYMRKKEQHKPADGGS